MIGKVGDTYGIVKDYENEPVAGYISVNANRTLVYVNFLGDELETEGQYKGKRKFDPERSYIVMWASDVKDLLDGRCKSVKVKKRKPFVKDG